MRLELARYVVRAVDVGARTALENGCLVVAPDELRDLVLADRHLTAVRVDVARPGDRLRIVHCLDVVEPRAKAAGPGDVFPGFLSPPVTVGTGRTNVLAGAAVVSTGLYRELTDPWWSNREAIIDMAAPGATSPFSTTFNVVLSFDTAPGLGPAQQDQAIRLAALRVARHLARAAQDRPPDDVETCELLPCPDRLPRVVYISHLGALGSLYNTYVYGQSVAGSLPTVLHPNELFDGAIVSGHFRMASERHPTYDHQNCPVATELLRRHGHDLDFAGVIVMRNLADLPEDKERLASFTAKLAGLLRADAAIVSRDGGGHAIFDLMTTCQRCEQIGIKTGLLVSEQAGTSGTDISMIGHVPEADLMVSTGNLEEVVEMAAVDRVLGGSELLGGLGRPGDALRLPVRWLYAANSQLGRGHLTARTW